MKSGNKTEVTKEYYPDGALRAIITEVYYSNDITTVFLATNGYIEVSNVKVSNGYLDQTEDFDSDGYCDSEGNFINEGCKYEHIVVFDSDGNYIDERSKIFFPNGTLKHLSKKKFKGINKIGASRRYFNESIKEYFPNGRLKYIGEYKSDEWEKVRIGEHKHFDKNGQLELVERFRKNGRRIGNVEGFYENGKPAFIENYKTVRDEEAAFQHGEWISYSRQGDINQRIKYKNGEYIAQSTVWDDLRICDYINQITYNDDQLKNDIVFKHFKREILLAFRHNSLERRDIFWSTEFVPDRIRNDEDIANEVIEFLDVSYLPTVFEYIGDDLKANEKFMDHYCECFRYMLRNSLPRKRKVLWTEPDCHSKNEMIRFLSIILELNEMDERIIDLPFRKWLSEKLGKYVSYEFFQSLNNYSHVFEAAYLEQ